MSEIVVGLHDVAGSLSALRWAFQQAQVTGARLTAVHVWRLPLDLEVTLDPMTRTALADSLDEAGPAPAPLIAAVGLPGQPGAVLVERARGADLLVVARNHHILPHGSVSEYCLHHSLTPVAVLPDAPNRCRARPRYVVVGVDLTERAAAALRWAAQQARASGAELIALHSWQVDARSLSGLGRSAKTRQGQQVHHEQRAQRWVEIVLGPSAADDLRLTVEHGAPLDHLLAWADQADLLVLPAPGHHAVPRLLAGSTSGQLAHLGLCPVVVVPTAKAATPAADRASDRRRPTR